MKQYDNLLIILLFAAAVMSAFRFKGVDGAWVNMVNSNVRLVGMYLV